MEFFSTLENYIIHDSKKNCSLWCNRADGTLLPCTGELLSEAWKPVCCGLVYGVIGKVQVLPGSPWNLLLISGQRFIGYMPGGAEVYQITKTAIVPMTMESETTEFEFQYCSGHGSGQSATATTTDRATAPTSSLQQKWNNFKATAAGYKARNNALPKDAKDRGRLERKLLKELWSMFNDSGSIYYSPNGDLTRSLQSARAEDLPADPIWKRVDDRFFWNKSMLKDLLELEGCLASHWILPIIQGYVEIKRCFINHLESLNAHNAEEYADDLSDDSDVDEEDYVNVSNTDAYHTGQNLKEDEFDLIVISRRSRHRAGTRYKRRGVDDEGNVANFVETEQLVCVLSHVVSYLLIRGSVPVYWSQPGLKYHPLPLIDRDFSESRRAFARHFDQDLNLYKQEVVISLLEQGGREKIIGDSFFNHILDYDNPILTYVTFDFHDYCRGMKFENIAILLENLQDEMKRMAYYWSDASGVIATQQSVFRVNCMDCLDRTNVVQAALARHTLEVVLRRLGRLLPDEYLPLSCRRVHNQLWANNGDAISRQYAGTDAMKGDFTRTGERRIAGIMKDGYNSASRYYVNRFKDTYRQTVIDMMQGNPIDDDLAAISAVSKLPVEDETWTSEKEECITQLVVHCRLSLLSREEEALGGWVLVDPFSFCDSGEVQDEDVILLVSYDAYYVARYRDDLEEVVSYQRVNIRDVEKVEIGPEVHHFKGQYMFMRLWYRHENVAGYFHSFRTMQNCSLDESKAILRSISDMLFSVCRLAGIAFRVVDSNKLEKRRTRPHVNIKPLSLKRTISSASRDMVRRRSETRDKPAGYGEPPSEPPPTRSHLRTRSLSEDVVGGVDSASVVHNPTPIPEIRIDGQCLSSAEVLHLHSGSSPNRVQVAGKPVGGRTAQLDQTAIPLKATSSSSARVSSAITKSASESQIRSMTKSSSSEQISAQKPVSKMDAFLRKTRVAIESTATDKLRSIKASLARTGQDPPVRQPIAYDEPLRTDVSRGGFPQASFASKLLPEFRSRIQSAFSSPKSSRRQNPSSSRSLHTEDEQTRMQNCRTRILEL